MSTTTQVQEGAPPGARFLEYDEYIEARIRATGRQVKATDLFAAIAVWLCGSILFFGVAAAVDGWVLRGGLPTAARFALAAIYAGGSLYFAWRWFLPLLVRKINPVYAARAIETNASDLKNALVNFLLLRGGDRRPPRAVMEAIEEQAVGRLTQIAPEAAIDRSWLVRSALLLAVLIVSTVLFSVVSPKNPLRTFARILAPWSAVDPPTRVQILDVTPGDGEVFYGERLPITARLEGMRPRDQATLLLSTRDGRLEQAEVTLRAGEDDPELFRGSAPPGQGGMVASGEYRIVAGDAISRPFSITVVQAPQLAVSRIALDFPAYTGLEDRAFNDQGDIKVVEGTRITLFAEANQPIADAKLDFENGGDVRLKPDGLAATASWRATLPPETGVRPFITGYQPRFTNERGLLNPRPVRHAYEVLPDQPPEAEFLEPRVRNVDLPIDESLEIELQARDPDFGLHELRLTVRRGDEELQAEDLLAEPWPGRFTHRTTLSPASLGAKVGDELVVEATAADGREPSPNVGATAPLRIRIAEPIHAEQEQQPSGQEPNDGSPRPDQIPANPDSEQQPRNESGESSEKPQPSGDAAQGESQSGGESNGGGTSGEESSSAEGESRQSPGGAASGDQSTGQEQGEGQEQNDPAQSSGAGGERSSGDAEQQPSGEGAESEQDAGDDTESPAGGAGRERSGGSNRESTGGDQDESAAEGGGSSSRGDSSNEPSPRRPAADDGDAFERLQRYLEDQQQDEAGSDENQADEAASDADPRDPGQDRQVEPGTDPTGGGREEGPTQEGPTEDGPSEDAADGDAAELQPREGGANDESGERSPNPGDDAAQAEESAGEPGEDAGQERPEAGGESDRSEAARETSEEDAAEERSGAQASQDQPDERQEPPGDGDEGPSGQAPEADGAAGQSGERDGADNQGAGEPSAENAENQGAENQGASESSQSPEEQSGENQGRPSTEQPPGGDAGEEPRQKPGQQGAGGQSEQDPREQSGEGTGPQQEQGPGDQHQPSGDSTGRENEQSNQGDETSSTDSQEPGPDDESQSSSAGEGSERSDSSPSNDSPGDESGREGESPSQQGRPPNDASGEQDGQSGDGGQDSSSDADQPPSEQSSERPPSGEPNGSSGDGGLSENPRPNRPAATEAPEADEVNLDYARQATELVLDKLRDQLEQDAVDEEMLGELGWNKAQLRRFVERWERLHQEAEQDAYGAGDARRQLDDALRSLGLSGRGARRAAGETTQDEVRGLEQGRRSEPPSKYRDLIRAFNRGMSRGPERTPPRD